MEDFLYAYNQPKKFGKYDLILDGKIIADEVVTKSGSIGGGGGDTSNCVKINEPITITEGDNTTSITSDTISTTTLTGTLDAESMKNSLTAEAIQAVVPMKWRGSGIPVIELDSARNCLLIGDNTACRGDFSTALGSMAGCYNNGTAVGYFAKAKTSYATALGQNSESGSASTSVGYKATCIYNASRAVTIGAQFTETTDSGNVTHYCTTEGTGSITIGAGANTKNTTKTVDGVETTVESSNSITIGCKASNTGADSVVIGAQAKGTGAGGVAIGAKAQAENQNDIAIGNNSHSKGNTTLAAGVGATVEVHGGTALGAYASVLSQDSLSVGRASQVGRNAAWSTAIGFYAKVSDQGVVVLATRSSASDDKKTQIYFAGAGTDLANQYYNGEAFMGYVVTDQAKIGGKNVLACGTRRLSELFPDNSLTQPATVDENGEWVMPKVFHPSDLDLPIEETPIEEEYKPLPIYPIVEPTIDEISE